MKIAVISSTIFKVPLTNYGGLEQVAWQRAEGLAKLGHDVTLYAPDDSHCDHAKVRPIGPPGGISEQEAYSKYWQELPNYDVIVDDSWGKYSYILKQEGKLNAPVLGVMHAPVNTMYQTLPPVEKPSIVCLSYDQAMHFNALFERECRVAYNGVDVDYYKQMEGVKRTDRFLFLARFSRIKGALIAIRACKEVGAKLDLVGDTSITNEPDYQMECAANCDGKNIRLIGPASRGECVRWFSQAHCFLHPIKEFREPFGLAPVEAQACGTPVIAWKRGAVQETVVPNKTGWLVSNEKELADQIHKAMTVGISTTMREDCRTWVRETLSVDHFVKRYEALCEEAIQTGGW